MVTSATSTTAATSTASTAVSATVYAKVESVMNSQSKGITTLNATLSSDQTKLSALGQLQSALSDFQAVATALSGKGLSTAATASNKTVLSASTDSSAVSGTYAIDVTQVAQGQVLTSAAQASATTAIGSGTIKIELGTTTAGGFTAGTAAATSITIDSSNNTLAGIAAAMQKAGINASVVQNGSGYALSVTGADGSASSMRISVSGDAALSGTLAYDPASADSSGLTQVRAAQDAKLTVDGKAITSASNTITGAITGTTLKLTAAGSSNVTVAQDVSQISTNVASFVSAYNALNAKLTSLKSGDLGADPALAQASSQLAQILKTGGSGSSAAALARAGVSLDSGTGKLQIDQDKLTAAIAADPDAMSKLFTNDGKGVADQLASKITALTGDDGRISKEIASTTKEVDALTAKKAVIGTALTAQAAALAALYTEQENAGSSWFGASTTGNASSIFDMMG